MANAKWKCHQTAGESWYGFEQIKPLAQFQDELALIPLPGHTRGHCGVAVRTQSGWLLHAGDAYFHENRLKPDAITPIGIRLQEPLSQVNGQQRRQNLKRLQCLAENERDVQIFCSHSQEEYEQLKPVSL